MAASAKNWDSSFTRETIQGHVKPPALNQWSRGEAERLVVSLHETWTLVTPPGFYFRRLVE